MSTGVCTCERCRENSTAGTSGINDYFWVNGDASQRSFREFFKNEELSDFVVETSVGKSFKCHKVVLAAASPVFRAMFRSPMTEGTSSKVQLNDASAKAVQLLLRMVYGKSAMVPVKLSLELYMLADRYQMNRTANKIAEATAKALTPEALFSILPEAHSMLSDTSIFVKQQIKRAAELMEVLPTCQQFYKWDLPLVQQVIQSCRSDQAYLEFQTAAYWVLRAHESRQQHWLDGLMPLIRFDCLTPTELEDIMERNSELLQLEGVGNALFKACCKKLRRGYHGYSPCYSPASPPYSPTSPPYNPHYQEYNPLCRSRSRSRSRNPPCCHRAASRDRSVSADRRSAYSGFDSDSDQDDVHDNADAGQDNANVGQDYVMDCQEHAAGAQGNVNSGSDNRVGDHGDVHAGGDGPAL